MRPWAIAAIAILCAASFAFAPVSSQDAGSVWNGRWEGTTVSGHQLVLQLQLDGQRITGRLTVGKQSAKIVYGKLVRDAFAFTKVRSTAIASTPPVGALVTQSS